MHKLLERQLRRARRGGDLDLDLLLKLVDAAYCEADRGRRVFAHLHEMMLEEHGALNARLSRLRDAVSQMGAGFAIWDGNDQLSLCNERLRELLPHVADLLRPGISFADLVAHGDARVAAASKGAPGDWAAWRVAHHREPTGPIEAGFADGRYVQIWEAKTGEGGIVGLYADIS